jgi:hypothetical protein
MENIIFIATAWNNPNIYQQRTGSVSYVMPINSNEMPWRIPEHATIEHTVDSCHYVLLRGQNQVGMKCE